MLKKSSLSLLNFAVETVERLSITFSINIELLIDDNDPITKKVKIPAKMTLII